MRQSVKKDSWYHFKNYRFEIDTLEIVLKEQLDVVDRFFLAEADFNYKGVRNVFGVMIVYVNLEEKTFHVGNSEEIGKV